MNPFLAANAVANPGQYAQAPVYGEENGTTESPLSAGGVAPNALNNLGGLASLFGGNNMSSSQDFSSGLGSVDFSNPYAGQSGPVASRQVVDYGSQPVLNPVNNTYKAPSPTAPFDWDWTPGPIDTNGISTGDIFSDSYNSDWNSSPTGIDNLDTLSNLFNNPSNQWGSTDLGFGASFNPGALSNLGGGWREGGRVFDFGNKSLGQAGAEFVGMDKDTYNNGRQALGLFGQFTGNRDIGAGLQISGLTGNRAFDMATKGTALEYINNPLSERSLLGTALNTQGLGGLMPGLDYLQGFNSKGGLLGAGISMVNPVAGGIFNFLSPELGGKVKTEEDLASYNPKYNENLGGEGTYNRGSYEEAANYAADKGVAPNSHEFDMVVDSYRKAMQGNNPYTKDFRDSMEEGRAQTQARAAADAQKAEIDRVAAEQQAKAQAEQQRQAQVAAEQQRQAQAAAAEAQRVAQAQAAAAEAQRVAQAQAQAEQERATMEANRQFSSSDSRSFDSGGNYSDWGSQAEYEDDQGDSSWSSSDSGGGDSGGGGGGSYIATAATQALGEEGLTIFEEWRDYMFTKLPTFTTSYGRYRVTAPKIVAEIDKRDNSKQLYSWIWDMHLKPIFNLIKEDKDSEKALRDYKTMVKELQIRFLKEKA
jgi:hypothetical protein